ncbi:MAG: hypothetical protein J5874_03345, partial [Oscillospiraceae bacterium]|nr:hypothetical protein [Oscillospiraceae bacterium]
MKIDEQKLEEMLKNEMNTTEKTPFSAKIPQKQPFRLPKWSFAAAGVAAAIAIVALVGVNGMKNKPPINNYESQVSDADAGEIKEINYQEPDDYYSGYESQVSDADAGKTDQEPDEYYSGPVDNTENGEKPDNNMENG